MVLIQKYLDILYEEAKKAKRILEIGIDRGGSTMELLKGCRDGNQGHLISIDHGISKYTERTVKKIQNSEYAPYFSWYKIDFYNIPDSWFKKHPMDLIFVDLNLRKEGIEKLILSMYKGSKLIMHNVVVFRNTREILLPYRIDDTYSYSEFLEDHGIGILVKEK